MSDAFDEEVSEPLDTEGHGVTLQDFVAFMPGNTFIFMPCREPWPAASINARFPRIVVYDEHGNPKRDAKGKIVTISPARWLAQNQAVEQMTWMPGLPMKIPDRLVVDGGWIERPGVTSFNLYRPPRLTLGDPSQAGPWLEHFHAIYPDDAAHMIQWLAFKVQHPADKPNHAILVGGEQGIGKDWLLEPVKFAVGHWNFKEISPSALLGQFNPFARAVILRVNEARDLGDMNRFDFYDHTKIYTAAPPDTLQVNEKHLRQYYIFNCVGLVITTNHKTDGIYLPPGDRRHYVAWSKTTKEQFSTEYWNERWGWYRDGGIGHVAAYLTELDLTGFDAKAAPPKTPAFWDVVLANTSPEDAELADVIDTLGNPDVLTLNELVGAGGAAMEWLLERKNRRAIPHRMERCGYEAVRNPNAKDALWKIEGKRQVVYGKAELGLAAQSEAIKRRWAGQ